MTQNKDRPLVFPWFAMMLLWLVGWSLRVTVLAAPPLALRIANTFNLGEAGTGALTMLPIVAISFGAIPAAWCIHHFGLRRSIAGGMALMALASIARGYVPSTALLFAVSIIMGLGVAIFQTALPAAVKTWTPTHVTMGGAVFINGMMIGEFSGAGLTLPIVLPVAQGDWKIALIIWSLPVILIAALVLFRPAASEPVNVDQQWSPRWNDKQAWQFGILLAGSIIVFYIINAYAASVLTTRGEEHILAGLLMAFNSTPMLASFLLLARPKWIGERGPVVISALFGALGLVGFALLGGWLSWACAVMAGFAATIELILLMSLPAKIATGNGVSRLNAGMTAIGYAFAFLVPLAGGWLADIYGNAELALFPALAFAGLGVLLAGREPHYTCSSPVTN